MSKAAHKVGHRFSVRVSQAFHCLVEWKRLYPLARPENRPMNEIAC
jgi:hypothetical protein